MRQVFIANPKGGCGKTTIAVHVAAHFAVKGKRVALIDHDALKSSSDWLKSRPASRPVIASMVTHGDNPIDTGDNDWIIHDLPAAWNLKNVDSLINAGDRVLIPVLSSPNDIKACLRFVMDLYRTGSLDKDIKYGFVANRIKMHTRYFEVLKEFLSRMELPLVACLRDTQNYVHCMNAGLSIFELPKSRVLIDVNQWSKLTRWLET